MKLHLILIILALLSPRPLLADERGPQAAVNRLIREFQVDRLKLENELASSVGEVSKMEIFSKNAQTRFIKP